MARGLPRMARRLPRTARGLPRTARGCPRMDRGLPGMTWGCPRTACGPFRTDAPERRPALGGAKVCVARTCRFSDSGPLPPPRLSARRGCVMLRDMQRARARAGAGTHRVRGGRILGRVSFRIFLCAPLPPLTHVLMLLPQPADRMSGDRYPVGRRQFSVIPQDSSEVSEDLSCRQRRGGTLLGLIRGFLY